MNSICSYIALFHYIHITFCYTVDGVWESWSNWTTCTHTCGPDGVQYRKRNCDGPLYGGIDCIGNAYENMTCNTEPCPSMLLDKTYLTPYIVHIEFLYNIHVFVLLSFSIDQTTSKYCFANSLKMQLYLLTT